MARKPWEAAVSLGRQPHESAFGMIFGGRKEGDLLLRPPSKNLEKGPWPQIGQNCSSDLQGLWGSMFLQWLQQVKHTRYRNIFIIKSYFVINFTIVVASQTYKITKHIDHTIVLYRCVLQWFWHVQINRSMNNQIQNMWFSVVFIMMSASWTYRIATHILTHWSYNRTLSLCF